MLTLIVLLLSLPGMANAQSRSEEASERNSQGAKLIEQGKADEAIAEFRKAVSLDPNHTTARLNLAYTYDRQGRSEEAMSEYQKVVELDPKSHFAHNNLGVLHDKKGLYDEAIGQFEKALQIDPSNTTAQKNLENAKKNKAVVQEREKKIAQAHKEVEAQPHSADASYKLARLYAFYGKKEQAMEWLHKALKLGFNDFDYLKADPALKDLRDDPNLIRSLTGR